jgi:hypothetical protein
MISILIMIWILYRKSLLRKYENFQNMNVTPKVLISTIKDKSKIPKHILENRKKFASNYVDIIFDDEDCIKFLEKYYGKKVSDKFKEIKKGAHKADLFRYAYLYKFGGLYVDIKTVFIKDVDTIFVDPHICYLTIVPRFNPKHVYNGVIYTPPNNKIMYDWFIKSTEITDLDIYFFNVNYAYKYLTQINSNVPMKIGYNETKHDIPNIIIMQVISMDKSICNNKLDRHGLCTFIVDENNTSVIKVRDSSYTPNYM